MLTGRKAIPAAGRGGRAGGRKKNRGRKEVENREKKSHLAFRHVAAATKHKKPFFPFSLRCCRKVQRLPRPPGAGPTRFGEIEHHPATISAAISLQSRQLGTLCPSLDGDKSCGRGREIRFQHRRPLVAQKNSGTCGRTAAAAALTHGCFQSKHVEMAR